MSVKSENRGKKMILAFGSGRTVHEICREFGVSESSYCTLISKFPEMRTIAKERVKRHPCCLRDTAQNETGPH